SDAVKLSSCLGDFLGGGGEGGGLVVVLAGGQAVVEAAEEAAEEVALAGGVEPVVLDFAAGDGSGFAGGAGDGGGAGVGLEAFGILEPGSVIADLGEHPGAGECAEPWEAGDDPGVRVQVKRLGDGVLEVVGGGAGGVELAEQGQGLPSHGLLDEGELAH